MSSADRPPPAPPATWALTAIGPGLLVAAAGIGAGDIVSATMAASRHGLALVWVVVLAAGLKGVLNEGIARWQLATGTTAVEGWCTHLPRWVRWYVVLYLVLWGGGWGGVGFERVESAIGVFFDWLLARGEVPAAALTVSSNCRTSSMMCGGVGGRCARAGTTGIVDFTPLGETADAGSASSSGSTMGSRTSVPGFVP